MPMTYDPYDYEGLDIYNLDASYVVENGFVTLVSGESSRPAHPHLEGYSSSPLEYWAVLEASPSGEYLWGPYITKPAAQSVIDERGKGRIVHMSLI